MRNILKDNNKIRILFYLNKDQFSYNIDFDIFIKNKFSIIQESCISHPRKDADGITLFIKRALTPDEFIKIIKRVFRFYIKGKNNRIDEMIFYYKDSMNSHYNIEYIVKQKN